MSTLITVLVVVALSIPIGQAGWRLKKSVDLARASEPLQQTPAEPANRLLIVGDSTGVGTGAGSPQASIAGLIANDHPALLIDNRSRDGARFADVVSQLQQAEGQRYDLVLVLAGGNDVIRLTDEEALRRAVDKSIGQAATLADQLIVQPPGNVGNAPFFFPPFSWWMTERARMLHAVVRSAVEAAPNARYVRLFEERDNDPFAQQPELNAADGLHPSAAGYRLWYDELREQGGFEQILRGQPGPR
ncbi:GDSL-type esterase/lipase family protein [Piscinibacter sakaiensis]|uniref:GDSL-type esterase/lipase family protein n=1 Tax=Piscinibacter sakaiensis TaxID=1547922 RepID=UPI003AB09BE2